MTDKKLTDGEIVKALKSLEKDTNCGDCAVIKQCKGDCVFTKTLDLINRLQAQNGVYETCNARKDEAIKHLESEVKRLQAENERLKIRLRKTEHQFDDAMKMYNIIKAEAYREFAERLKTRFLNKNEVINNTIDNLLKELVGEDNESKN